MKNKSYDDDVKAFECEKFYKLTFSLKAMVALEDTVEAMVDTQVASEEAVSAEAQLMVSQPSFS